MLSINETYCDLRVIAIGKRTFLSDDPGETRPANGCSLDGTLVAEIVHCIIAIINKTGERKSNTRVCRVNTDLQVFNSKRVFKILCKNRMWAQDLC